MYTHVCLSREEMLWERKFLLLIASLIVFLGLRLKKEKKVCETPSPSDIELTSTAEAAPDFKSYTRYALQSYPEWAHYELFTVSYCDSIKYSISTEKKRIFCPLGFLPSQVVVVTYTAYLLILSSHFQIHYLGHLCAITRICKLNTHDDGCGCHSSVSNTQKYLSNACKKVISTRKGMNAHSLSNTLGMKTTQLLRYCTYMFTVHLLQAMRWIRSQCGKFFLSLFPWNQNF